ncbi:MAG TPA: hypothetical protein VHO70_04880 [Chitinispirillaceae bacterium]|nr:hypothetical protein [Chitinispirillaceae bacterium]
MQNLISLALILWTIFFVSCSEQNQPKVINSPETKLVPNTGEFKSIIYHIWSGWTKMDYVYFVDYKKMITVKKDAMHPAQIHDTLEGTISAIQYDSLMNIVNTIDVNNLESDYRCKMDCPEDLPAEEVIFSMDGW